MRRLTAALSVLSLAALGVSAAAVEPPTYEQQRVFFHCATTKAGNAGALVGALPSFDTTAPTASIQGGAGCGSTNAPGLTGATHAGLYDAVFVGTHVGNIKDIGVELHVLDGAVASRAGLPFGVDLEVLVDGVAYAPSAVVVAAPEGSSTGASERVLLTLTGFKITEDLDRDGLPDAGPGTLERSISVKVRHGYIDQAAGPFVYDTTEVPSGLVFNPAARLGVAAAVSKV